MLQVGLYFIILIIIVMKQACLKCIDCCFKIGDKVFFFFFFSCMCEDVFIIWFVKHWTGVSFPTFPSWEMYLTDITAQTTPVSTDVSWQTKHILPSVHGRVTNMAAILPFKIGVVWIQGVKAFPLCWLTAFSGWWFYI